mmetsp:Transcript_19964/g.27651  ORF Transcript_19964/g.27651 Transcript_19964/m.27651 type:complete len:103 (-) Transcript_19964:142-450(-)|eukprot:CAMPEP_0196580374 /NCGR_PEP_ID=MMETSP1081-20130531/28591_1 /TAXON_ID=36882 /ORGANISM="Pyramimonas amylifera, Strain CCMP720" /LENGTH=102 /DNA_ID=CAMNT_0041900225 /DNA_START=86 /DNA_END=394 /DNA_ORIENTATION=-
MASHLFSHSANLAFTNTIISRSARASTYRSVSIVRASGEGLINKNVKKEEAKVVDMLSCSEIKGKAVMCRCWKSAKFPYCDGKHVEHNKNTGDNVGPLIISE